MKERSEDQILSLAPFQTKLGADTVDFPPLPILKAQAWRKLFSEKMAAVTASFNAPADATSFSNGLTAALLEFPDVVVELVVAFNPSLDREKILESATDEQMAFTFSGIMKLAFPYWGQLKMAMQVAATVTK